MTGWPGSSAENRPRLLAAVETVEQSQQRFRAPMPLHVAGAAVPQQVQRGDVGRLAQRALGLRTERVAAFDDPDAAE